MKAAITVSVGLGALLMFFQNCGNVRFADVSTTQSSAKLTALSLGDDEQDMSNVVTGQVQQTGANSDNTSPSDTPPTNNPPVDMPPMVAPPTQTLPSDTGKQDEVVRPSVGLPNNDPDCDKDDVSNEDSESSDDDDGLVACILKQHGKSLKLGLIQEELGGVNSVARSVCISRSGCMELVSAKFEVEGAYDRGYCKGNPNVVRLTDAQLIELLK